MSTGQVPARHVAVYGGNIPLMTHGASEAYGEGDLNIPYSEGGRLLDYEDEDSGLRIGCQGGNCQIRHGPSRNARGNG